MTTNQTDIQLVEGCRAGQRLAQRQLYQRYYGRMLGIAMRYTSNKEDATDILNKAFLKVFQSVDQYQEKGTLGAWIARIVFTTAIDFVRSRTHYLKVMDFNVEKDVEIEPSAIEQLETEDLFKTIQELPKETRTVFSLYVIDGYKHREIAELLDINENTSKWHLARAKKILQKRLKNYASKGIVS